MAILPAAKHGGESERPPTGKRITAAELFCRLAPCTQAELPFVANESLRLGLDLSELEDVEAAAEA